MNFRSSGCEPTGSITSVEVVSHPSRLEQVLRISSVVSAQISPFLHSAQQVQAASSPAYLTPAMLQLSLLNLGQQSYSA